MCLYDKVYNILNYKYIPSDNYYKLNQINNQIHSAKIKSNKLTASYYSERIKELYAKKYSIINEISCFKFYSNLNDRYTYDLHGIHGYQVDAFLDAIFDYNYIINQSKFNLITGKGNVIKLKTLKYLKYFNINFINLDGFFKIINFT